MPCRCCRKRPQYYYSGSGVGPIESGSGSGPELIDTGGGSCFDLIGCRFVPRFVTVSLIEVLTDYTTGNPDCPTIPGFGSPSCVPDASEEVEFDILGGGYPVGFENGVGNAISGYVKCSGAGTPGVCALRHWGFEGLYFCGGSGQTYNFSGSGSQSTYRRDCDPFAVGIAIFSLPQVSRIEIDPT